MSLTKEMISFFEEWSSHKRAFQDNLALSISIFQGDQVLHQSGMGFANLKNKRDASAETIYRVASISKLLTSMAILMLSEKNAFQLQTKVLEILPDIQLSSDFDFKDVTIENLLTHTSGLPRESAHNYWSSLEFPNKKEVMNGLSSQSQVMPKNQMWKYSNLAFALLGEIIAQSTNEPFEKFIEENIFKPLKMKNSFFRNMDIENVNFATGYGRKLPSQERKTIPFKECLFISSAANLCSNVIDLTLFLQAIIRKDPVLLREATYRDMAKMHICNSTWTNGYGLGIKLIKHNHLTLIGHGGAFQGYMSNAYFDKESQLGVIILTNSTDSESLTFTKYAFELIEPTLNKASKANLPSHQLLKYEGRFRNDWRDVLIKVINGELRYFVISDAKPFHNKVILEPQGENIFIFKTNIGGYSAGEKVQFEKDSSGEIVFLRIGSGGFRKINSWLDEYYFQEQ